MGKRCGPWRGSGGGGRGRMKEERKGRKGGVEPGTSGNRQRTSVGD